MAEVSWPSPDDGRVVDERQYEILSSHYTEDGVFMDPNGVFIDTAGGPVYADASGRNVKVRAGIYANVRGFGWASGTTDITLTIAENATGLVRTDRVVLELSRSTWNVRAKIVQGTAGSGVPALTRNEGDTGLFQVPIARVTVVSGATVILAENVYVEGHRVGSRVRAWITAADMLYPKIGEIGYDAGVKRWFGWNGVAREYISGLIPPEPVGVISDDSGTTSSATYTESLGSSTPISVNFVAGLSGKANVRSGGLMKTSNNPYDVSFGVRIRRFSDNVIVKEPAFFECAVTDVESNSSVYAEYIVTGLTPGTTYKAIGVHKVEDPLVIGYYDNRRIFVTPF